MVTQVVTEEARPTAPHAGRTPPILSGGLPIIGHAAEFFRDAMGLLFRTHRECGEVGGFKLVNKKMFLLTGAAANEAFFRAPDEQLSPQEAYKMMTPVFGKDVAYDAKPPSKMNEQLGMLLPALQDRRMRTYGEIIAHEVDLSMTKLGDEGTVDFVAYCAQLTNFTSSHCLLGPEFRNELTSDFAAVYHDLEKGIHPIGYLNPYLPIPAFRRRDRARVRLQEMIGKIVQQRKNSSRQGEDFLQTLMDAKYKGGAKLSDHEITGMLLAAMFAGHHTSSVTTAWTVIELLRNPYYLRRLLAQLEQVYADGKEITFQSLREITLVEWAVKETLRLHPPLFMLLRAVMRDFSYGGYSFPAGSYLVVSPLVSHRIPEAFKDPERFDPDRFGPERREDQNIFNFISFGGGRHKCMGNAFALLQVKTILAKLFLRYEISLGDDPVAGDFTGVVAGPRSPFRLHYRRRRDAGAR
jgi:sterol 14-demethylase